MTPTEKVTVTEGKVADFSDIKSYLNENDILYSEVLEEKVLLRFQDKEYIATLKGVDANFKSLNAVDSMLVSGDYIDSFELENTAVVGQGVAFLSITNHWQCI